MEDPGYRHERMFAVVLGWLARAKFRYVRSCLGDAQQ